MKKSVLITGTSSGVGLALTVSAAKRGWKVFATMRNLDKQEPLQLALREAGLEVHLLQMDVQNEESIAQALEQVVAHHGELDVLVNNAGQGFLRTTEQADWHDIKNIFDINFYGVVRMTQKVLPLMRKAKKGHIVTLSSVGGLVGQPFNEIYCASKFAVEGYIESLASYVTPGFGIQFTLVEPGGITSEFAKTVLQNFQKSGGMLDDEYAPLLNAYMQQGRLRAKEPGVYQTSDAVAELIMSCMLSSNPPLRMRTSAWSEEFCDFKTQADPNGLKLNQMVVEKFLGAVKH